MTIKIPSGSHCAYCDSTKYLQRYEGVMTCSKHRTQLVRHGKIFDKTRFDKNEIIESESYCQMPLHNKKGSKTALFDKGDKERIIKHKWGLDKDNYVVTMIKGKRVTLHRFILGYFGENDIDHKNHLRFDNRRDNIRIVTRSQNLQNRNSKGVGIDHRNKYKKFRAYITLDKKRIELGLFETEAESLKVRQEAVKKYFGEFAYNPKMALDDFGRLF